jgi:gliding motility-associated-like protein
MSRLLLAVPFLFLFARVVSAQSPHVSRKGDFQVDQKKGCAPFTVTATTLKTPGPFSFDFLGNGFGNTAPEDQNNATGTASFTYATPGKYLLRFCISSNCNSVDSDDIEIEVTANTTPVFDLFTCSNNGVQIKVNDIAYNQYVIDYNDASANVVVPSGSLAKDVHVFGTTGTKTISVRGRNLNAADNCVTANKSFTALAAMPLPTINSLSSINNSELDVEYSLPANVQGRLDIATNGNATFQLLKTPYSDSRDTLKNVSNNNNFYCVRMGATDACSNTTTYAPSVCTLVLTATANNGFNQLDWVTNSINMVGYSLKRDAQAGFLTFNTPNDRTRNDTESICNTEHCYTLTANYPGGATSTSLTRCVTSFNTNVPPTLSNINASFDNSAVDVTWSDPAEAKTYSIFKNNNNGSFALAATTDEPPYRDTDFSLPAASCYEISYTDACENRSSASLVACPIVLSATLSSNNVINLSWTPYQGWQNGVASYQLQKFSASGALLKNFDVSTATAFIDDEDDNISRGNQLFRYIVVATAVDGTVTDVNSNTVEVIKNPNLFYPTAFTPDGKGPTENEVFKVFAEFVSVYDMKIFNRWGELVFSSTDLDLGWDGTFRGTDQPDGTYTFLATITDTAGRSFTRSGSVVLVRKK